MRTILNWYQDGGPFILPLLLVGLAGVLLLAERTMYLVSQSRIHVRPFIEKVISLVHADKPDEALKLCAEHQSALPDLGLVLLRSKSRGESDLIHVAETATLTVLPSLSRRLAWLPALAIIAVLLGVVGGLANLHEALVRSADPLRIGVAYALRPFGVGVLTAIPLVAGYAYLVYASEKLVAQLHEFSARLVNALLDRPDVRLGHRA